MYRLVSVFAGHTGPIVGFVVRWLILITNCIAKIYLYNFDPLKPHFYIVKLGFTGVCFFFLFLLKNINCEYPLEPPRWGGSNGNRLGEAVLTGTPQFMFWAEIWKISEFLSENFQFLVVKFSIYLNGSVFVMNSGLFEWQNSEKNINKTTTTQR